MLPNQTNDELALLSKTYSDSTVSECTVEKYCENCVYWDLRDMVHVRLKGVKMKRVPKDTLKRITVLIFQPIWLIPIITVMTLLLIPAMIIYNSIATIILELKGD